MGLDVHYLLVKTGILGFMACLAPNEEPGLMNVHRPTERGIRQYYQSRTVVERMTEFLGGADLQSATAVYVAGNNGFVEFEILPPGRLPEYLEAGLEVDRSLWDRDSLIVHIDLEYNNFDQPAAAWLDPERAFRLQQPVLDATLGILAEAGIAPLTLVSGRGYHLTWAVRRDSNTFCRLIRIGRVPPSLQARYAQFRSPLGWSVDREMGRAFAGLGLLMEFIWHRVLAASAANSALSIQPTAIEVGPGEHGREIVSFDISEYGDPLHTRQIRLPFSAYLKPRQFEWMLGEEGVRRLLPIFEIPLSGMTTKQAIAAARDPDQALDLARCTSVRIPDASAAMENLLNAYEASPLSTFHDRFYSQLSEPAGGPREKSISDAPACAQWLLEYPNDWLLKPAALQHIVRVLMALDWTPASIARLISATYLKDYGWGDLWTRLDPCNRAIYYTRLFAGMIAAGADTLIDFNCASHKEKGYCMIPECPANLVTYRDRLLRRERR